MQFEEAPGRLGSYLFGLLTMCSIGFLMGVIQCSNSLIAFCSSYPNFLILGIISAMLIFVTIGIIILTAIVTIITFNKQGSPTNGDRLFFLLVLTSATIIHGIIAALHVHGILAFLLMADTFYLSGSLLALGMTVLSMPFKLIERRWAAFRLLIISSIMGLVFTFVLPNIPWQE